MKPTKDWIGNNKSTFVTLGASNHAKGSREKNDYYATDPITINELLEVESFDGDIWECACGGGHMSKRLEQLGHNVVSTDLIDRGVGISGVDFLETKELLAPNIITNPPYKLAKEFVEHSLDLGSNKVAMFLKLTFLESKSRYELFKKYPPKTIYVYSSRRQVAINGEPEMFNKSSAACYAWFVWQKGFIGDPKIKWIR